MRLPLLPTCVTYSHGSTCCLPLSFGLVCNPQVTLRCALSRRQAQLYAALRKNLTLQDLVAMNSKMAAAAAGAGTAGAGAGAAAGGAAGAAPAAASSSSAASARLMGLIMQMRKVGKEGQQDGLC
jgi:hypothetical protein